MGSHHQVAILVPDEKLEYFGKLENFFCLVINDLAFYTGPVLLIVFTCLVVLVSSKK